MTNEEIRSLGHQDTAYAQGLLLEAADVMGFGAHLRSPAIAEYRGSHTCETLEPGYRLRCGACCRKARSRVRDALSALADRDGSAGEWGRAYVEYERHTTYAREREPARAALAALPRDFAAWLQAS